jgi:vacuolar iron transporter family protein
MICSTNVTLSKRATSMPPVVNDRPRTGAHIERDLGYSAALGRFHPSDRRSAGRLSRFAVQNQARGAGMRSARPELGIVVPRLSNHVAPHGLFAIARHYIGDLVYGANDGLVTTFAAVAGVEGGALTAATVLIVGVANLAADGLSMGIGNYLAIRARESAREADDLPEDESQPARHGIVTFLAFVVAGSIPLLPYAVGAQAPVRAWSSATLTLVTLFALGAARGVVTNRAWWRTGFEILLLGGLAGAAAYAAGATIARILGAA